MLHSRFSVGRRRRVATAVLIAQTELQLGTPALFMPPELDLQGRVKKKKRSKATIARQTGRGKAHIVLFGVERSLHFWFWVITVWSAAQNILSEAAAGSSARIRHPLSAARRLASVSPSSVRLLYKLHLLTKPRRGAFFTA